MPHSIEDIEKAQKDFSKRGEIPLHSYWKHYKGELYQVVGFVMMESTEEKRRDVLYSLIPSNQMIVC
jgi:hypothetical protein